ISIGSRDGYFGDIANLAGEIVGHGVHVVGQIFPSAGYARHDRLAAELAFGPDLAGNAADFSGERIELVDHRVDSVLQLEDFAFDIDRDLSIEVATCNRRCDLGDIAYLGGQVSTHGVDGVGKILPCSSDARHGSTHAEPSLGADFARDAGHFRSEAVELIDHGVDRVLERQNFALHFDGDL